VRIVVDTSVWVEYFRGRSIHTRDTMHRLLDEDRVGLAIVVRIELLAGVGHRQVKKLRRLLDAVPTYLPGDGIWATTERWAVRAAGEGHRFGIGDLLVGAIASEHGLPIWSLDRDFERMASLGLVRVYEPGS
jgi:predicted nucleic acid-binding protein